MKSVFLSSNSDLKPMEAFSGFGDIKPPVPYLPQALKIIF